MANNVRLLVSCPDRKGLIAALSSCIDMHDGNILSADQYVSDSGPFFMRLEIEGEGFGLSREEFAAAYAPRTSPRAHEGSSPALGDTDLRTHGAGLNSREETRVPTRTNEERIGDSGGDLDAGRHVSPWQRATAREQQRSG